MDYQPLPSKSKLTGRKKEDRWRTNFSCLNMNDYRVLQTFKKFYRKSRIQWHNLFHSFHTVRQQENCKCKFTSLSIFDRPVVLKLQVQAHLILMCFVCFIALYRMRLTDVGLGFFFFFLFSFFTNCRQDPPPTKRLGLALLW